MRAAAYTVPIESAASIARWLLELAARRIPNLDLTMALCGHRDIQNVTADILVGGAQIPAATPSSHLRVIG